MSDMPVHLCGGDATPGPRGDCPDELHDYPLPDGYIDALDTASRRLAKRWSQRKCRACGLYGWIPGRPLGDGSDGPVTVADD